MLVLAHRGFVGPSAPENTLAAVDRALRAGADGVEVDVRLTADGIPVLHHDAHLRRTANDPRHVEGLRWSELPRIGRHAIPTVHDLLALVGHRGRVVLELKPGSGPGQGERLLAAVASSLGDADVVLSSFDRRLILKARALPVRTALRGQPGLPLSVCLGRARTDGHDEVHPHLRSVLPRLNLLGGAGPAIIPWTVDRPVDLGRLSDAGADAVISDDPEAARSLLDARQLLRAG